jgi:hypothetical protein
VFVPAQQKVVGFLATFKEFPPRQKAASFTVDQVLEQLQAVPTGSSYGCVKLQIRQPLMKLFDAVQDRHRDAGKSGSHPIRAFISPPATTSAC